MKVRDRIHEKREWQAFKKRVDKLPKDYRIVYKEIQKYIFKVGPVEIVGEFSVLTSVIELFEEGSISGRNVLEVTGEDVAKFCDDLLKESKTYMDIYMESYHQKVVAKAMRKKEE